MKFIIATLFAFNTAAAASGPALDFSACEMAQPIALLAKDNRPYWSGQDVSATERRFCYETLKTFADSATADDIVQLEEAFDGQVRIITNDDEFAAFINSNSPASLPFIVDQETIESITPIMKPKKTLFQN